VVCPFANQPEATGGRWGQGLTAEKMADCRWVHPASVARFEFVEWTSEGHLRHVHFVGLWEGLNVRDVVRRS
jgi:bifunctional non-homologous end joining protein LigD